jgi:hypothetical protein
MKHTLSKACALCSAPLGSSANKRQHVSRQLCFQCKQKGPTEEYRCTATTHKGSRCRHWTLDGTVRCRTHEVKE